MNTLLLIVVGVAILYTIGDIRRAVTAMRSLGLVPYARWILLRDVRFALTIAFIILQVYALLTGLTRGDRTVLLLVLIVPAIAYNLSKSLSPPEILLLHSFDERNYDFARRLVRALPAITITSPFPHRISAGGVREQAESAMVGVGSRVAGDGEWRDMIRCYMKLAEIIILDLSYARRGVLEELEFVATSDRLQEKLVLVFSSVEAATAGLTTARSICPKIPAFEYDAEPRFDFLHSDRQHELFIVLSTLLRRHFIFPFLRSKSGLAFAISKGYKRASRFLIERGVSIHGRPTDKLSPLMAASMAGDPETTSLLLSRGAQANIKNPEGLTALMFGAASGSLPVVQLLLKAGANPNAIDAQGRTALDFAMADEQRAICRELQPLTTRTARY